MRLYYMSKNDHSMVRHDRNNAYHKNAHFAAVGSWVEDSWGQCAECGWHGQKLGEPLLVEWEPSSKDIADFSWDGPRGLNSIVTIKTMQLLVNLRFESCFGQVKYVEPETKGKHTVAWPYDGPEQRWLMDVPTVEPMLKESGISIQSECKACGRVKFNFKLQDIVVSHKELGKCKMFKLSTNGVSSAKFVTEEAMEELLSHNVSGIEFVEAGVCV